MARQAQTAKLLIGCSGYSYREWIEAGVYPQGTKQTEMLARYAEEFPIVELNYTWHRMPTPEMIERQRQQAPPGFPFAAKLTKTLTHEVDSNIWRENIVRYRDALAPLTQAGQLAAVLVQLPPSFDRTPKNRRYLAHLLDALHGLPIAIEFRHKSWAHDRVFAELERRKVTLVAVDEPKLPHLFPALDVVTNPEQFYVRFHGRNAAGWQNRGNAHPFDYDYSDDELSPWAEETIERMTRRAKKGLIFFNNHVSGQAPHNARRLAELLAEQGLYGS